MEKENQRIAELNELIKAKDLDRLTEVLSNITGNPVMLTDMTHKLLACYPHKLDDEMWNDVVSSGAIHLSQLEIEESISVYQRSMEEERPIADSKNGGPSCRCAAVICGGRISGCLNVLCKNVEHGQKYDDIIMLAASVAGLYMEKILDYGKPDEKVQDRFIADLLEGRIKDEDIIEERLKYFNLELKLPLMIVVIRDGFDYDPTDIRDVERVLRETAERFESTFTNIRVFIMGRELRVFMEVDGKPKVDDPKIVKFTRYLKKEGLRAGISRPFFHMSDVAAYHLQAVKACELGERFEVNAPLYNYDNFAVYHLLEYGAASHDLMTFCHTAVFILAEYDRSHNTDLLETLRVYLNCHCNAQEAASHLYIHRNTMNYRISKITDLTNLDLTNTESFFHLMLSFRILAYYSLTVMKDYQEQKFRHPIQKFDEDKMEEMQ